MLKILMLFFVFVFCEVVLNSLASCLFFFNLEVFLFLAFTVLKKKNYKVKNYQINFVRLDLLKKKKKKKFYYNLKKGMEVLINSEASVHSSSLPVVLSPTLVVVVEDACDSEKFDFTEFETAKYELDLSHLDKATEEWSELLEVTEEHNSEKLLKIYDSIKVTSEQLEMWAGYGDTTRALTDEASTRKKLATVIEYAESNPSVSVKTKNRLRVITKLLMEQSLSLSLSSSSLSSSSSSYDPSGILLLLAAHGNVCNVQKEIGIQSAYGLVTNNLSQVIEQQSVENSILRMLKEYRRLLVEELYKTFQATNNIHSIALMNNELSDTIGVDPIDDTNIRSWGLPFHWKVDLDRKYFTQFYTVDHICLFLNAMLREKKLSFSKVIQQMEHFFNLTLVTPFASTSSSSSSSSSYHHRYRYAFLSHAVDSSTGDIRPQYWCWLLRFLHIVQFCTADDLVEKRRSCVQCFFFL
ncbi:hypothetical protein RFI_08711 [Reticulomyxa filosa]|uniref:Uncharacterized protein n=1 Tax=Reticulomyxa filosa TaxID=46433 RepID=X6NQ71_RETFI|nr:hypothetical protein RFI_08711 [Reticulomyxa filosa]|eukprot:ETO28420.1 hypothetical protein RFI_08711 [Reticulomyxa filosa]